jgi:hypothetical protein
MKKQLTCQRQDSVCTAVVFLVYVYMGKVKEKYCKRRNESWAEVIHIFCLLTYFLIHVSYFTVWNYRLCNLLLSVNKP